MNFQKLNLIFSDAMFQTIAVNIILIVVIVFAIYSAYKSLKGQSKSPCDHCEGCDLREKIKHVDCENFKQAKNPTNKSIRKNAKQKETNERLTDDRSEK